MNNQESKSLLEVWEWKEKAFKEIEHMEIKEALKERINKSNDTSSKLGFKTVSLVRK